jgi:hypothetical protein
MQFNKELNKIQLESVLSHNSFENLMCPRFLKTAVIPENATAVPTSSVSPSRGSASETDPYVENEFRLK